MEARTMMRGWRILEAVRNPRFVTPVRRATIGSVGAAFGGQLILLISGIALARLLGPIDRGYFALLTLWPIILFQIVDVGLPGAVAFYVARGRFDTRKLEGLLGAPIAIQCSLLLLAHLGILLVYLHGKPADVALAGGITLTNGPALLAWDYSLAVLQGLKKYAALNAFRYLQSALTACAALVMLSIGHRSLPEITLLTTLGYFACAILATVTARHNLVASPTTDIAVPFRRLLSFGLRGYVGSLNPLDAFRLDLVIVGLLANPLSVGLYVVASSVTNLPRFVAVGVILVALPHIAATVDYRSQRSLILRFTLFGGAVSLVGVLVLEAVVGELIPFFFGASFRGAIVVSQILLIGVLCLAVRRILSESLKGAGFPTAGTMSEVASWLALIPALGLMGHNGIVGIAWALSIAFASGLGLLVIVAIIWDMRQRTAIAGGL